MRTFNLPSAPKAFGLLLAAVLATLGPSEPARAEVEIEESRSQMVETDQGAAQSEASSPEEQWSQARALAEENPWYTTAHFNAGLAAARAGELGFAILHLERARYLRPFSGEIRKTLSLVRQQAQRERMEHYAGEDLTRGEPSALTFWRMFNALPHRLWVYIGGSALWLAALLVLLRWRMVVGVRRDIVSTVAGFSALVALVALSAWGGAISTTRSFTPAVVTDAEPGYRRAPDELSRVERDGELYEGAVVLIHGTSGAWVEIEIAEGRHVWVEPEQLQHIRDFPSP